MKGKRMILIKKTLVTALVLTVTASALADWNTADPAKWVQLPDLQTGMDVRAMWGRTLADDFKCTLTGPITDIHIWGSWLNDFVDPNVQFRLSFHADVPAGMDPNPTNFWSHPGTNLWSMGLKPTSSRIYAQASEEFYDPTSGQVIGHDTQVWQYNFTIDEALAFPQREGNIYWLEVQAFSTVTNVMFGWKTSLQHWNDDAVWAFATGGQWNELRDLTGQSLDLAFVLTTVPEPSVLALIGIGGVLALRWRRQA